MSCALDTVQHRPLCTNKGQRSRGESLFAERVCSMEGQQAREAPTSMATLKLRRSTAALEVGVGSAQPHKTCFQQHISERKGQQGTDLVPAVALNREVQRGFHRAWSLFYHSNSMATLGTGDID